MASENGRAQRSCRNTALVSDAEEILAEQVGKPDYKKWQSCRRKDFKADTTSTSEHEEFWRNKRGPSRKAKYDHVTDSE